MDGVDGFLVPVGDVSAMADALERLARDPDLRAQMGEAGRERVVPRYRVERLVDDVDALYRELLGTPGCRCRVAASALPVAAGGTAAWPTPARVGCHPSALNRRR